jgi:hypothetical protein
VDRKSASSSHPLLPPPCKRKSDSLKNELINLVLNVHYWNLLQTLMEPEAPKVKISCRTLHESETLPWVFHFLSRREFVQRPGEDM